MSANSSIQGQMLDITVVGCNKLKNAELFSRQDPYVCLQYGSTNYRTRTCTDGGKSPTFGDKFQITLIEGLHEINVSVWNSNKFTRHDFIGSGRIQLGKVLNEGFHDGVWQLQTTSSRYAGDLKLIMHFPKLFFQRCQSAPAQFFYSPPPQTYKPTAYPPQQQYPPPPPPPQTYQPTAYPPQQQYPWPYPPQQKYPPPP